MSNDGDDSDVEMCETPPEIRDAATTVTNNLLPEKSRKQYEKAYKDFMAWIATKNTRSVSENVLLVYFEHLSTKFKPVSLWTYYSMLKSTINIRHEVDISKYYKLIAFLKRKSEGYTGKKSKTFLPEEIEKFLNEAPDQLYLMQKVSCFEKKNCCSLFFFIFNIYMTYMCLFGLTPSNGTTCVIVAGSLDIWNNGCVPKTRILQFAV